MTDTPIGHVTHTAFLIAHYRAAETARADALFHDPFAAKLSGKKGSAIGKAMSREMTAWMVSLRTVVIDDFIREKIESGADAVLNLGAGLDARPTFRLRHARADSNQHG